MSRTRGLPDVVGRDTPGASRAREAAAVPLYTDLAIAGVGDRHGPPALRRRWPPTHAEPRRPSRCLRPARRGAASTTAVGSRHQRSRAEPAGNGHRRPPRRAGARRPGGPRGPAPSPRSSSWGSSSCCSWSGLGLELASGSQSRPTASPARIATARGAVLHAVPARPLLKAIVSVGPTPRRPAQRPGRAQRAPRRCRARPSTGASSPTTGRCASRCPPPSRTSSRSSGPQLPGPALAPAQPGTDRHGGHAVPDPRAAPGQRRPRVGPRRHRVADVLRRPDPDPDRAPAPALGHHRVHATAVLGVGPGLIQPRPGRGEHPAPVAPGSVPAPGPSPDRGRGPNRGRHDPRRLRPVGAAGRRPPAPRRAPGVTAPPSAECRARGSTVSSLRNSHAHTKKSTG